MQPSDAPSRHPSVLDEHPVWSIDPRRGPPPVRREWMLANGLGGFAMGTVLGVPTRRYHGLLVAAMAPPVLRMLMLAAVDDTVVLDPSGEAVTHRLTRFHFATAPDRPCLHPYLVKFEKEDRVRWTFELPGPGGEKVTVRKTVELADRRNAVLVRYELPEGVDARLELRPLVALRDFHALIGGHEYDITARELPGPAGVPGVLVARRDLGLHLTGRGMEEFNPEPDTWRSIELLAERERGLDDREDWFCPGVFVAQGPGTAELIATTDASGRTGWQDARDERRRRRRGMIDAVLDATHHAGDERARTRLAQLAAAADAYIVHRAGSGPAKTSVIAGYPWFADWGRDTMIALPGLLLATGRAEEAFDTLRTFAHAQRRGLIPNRFDDHAGPAHYNTVDASLWFIHACAAWLDATGDRARFTEQLRPACERVIRAYLDGTDYQIGVDPIDGLVSAGSPETQLTWMDARRDGVVFTPRHGKAVEINALWVHALRSLSAAIERDDGDTASELDTHADRAARSFRSAFLGGPLGGLTDCLTPEPNTRSVHWVPAREVRPNQIFAASLAYAPLETAERRAVVRVVRERLLTPAGLRTLDPDDPAYRAWYEGSLFERDRAYHNGTVWPWLLGPFCEALMRSEDFSEASRGEAADRLLGLTGVVDTVSIGQIPEVADAEPGPDGTHRFDGCPAQAWSVAETLRVLMMALRRG
ncbi:MAG: amylo-alpha-1,6-glucosidase [Phycisphaerales bacterium]|nr:glycogen debranching enzyme family protein [Planctomycetota bacterium]MCH8509608.1 amylo-alpha-1,6-glucosidase [Phycisphaerales bacterium]